MCGFVGILGRRGDGELARMAEAVRHRGPDDHGEFDGGAFAARHHRLSIIGPDARGHQPMTVDDVTVVFNGCIYNYPELRQRLERDGVVFHSDTDTEVLPHLYRRFGFGMFGLLNGMFAVLLWDAREELLVAARDPFGEKPLFVCEQDGRVGFASRLDAFERGDWQLTPDTEAVYELLTRMRVTAPRSMYQEIRQLPPGSYAVLRAGQAIAPRRYFFLPEPDQPNEFTPAELQAEAARLLDEAFAMRAMADRPMGVFLSGGIDSSLIAESLARQLPERLHTFSVRFSGATADYDESEHAAAVAAHIGSAHTVLEVKAEAQASLHELAAAFDQPVTNSAALPTFLIARAAKPHVDVALSGVGGDELFGGYPRYLGMRWHERLQRLPGRGLLLAMVRAMGESGGSRNRRGRLRRFLEGLDLPADQAYLSWTATTSAGRDEMFTLSESGGDSGWLPAAAAYGGLAGLVERYGPVNGAMAWDMLTYLPDDLLAMGDRMSMAHALELRAPFLDTRLMNLAMLLPEGDKVEGWPWQEKLKLTLRNIARQRLPLAIVERPKQGFMAPVKHWLRGELAQEIERLCVAAPLGGLVRPEYVRSEWARHRAGEDRSDILWGLLLVDNWMQARSWKF
ncbi:MAG TPA: asparagine synthase (glutamine-hydrolyzing) [Mariprofundaceae bacterium]|nr:asparagine synthase (glutamine-hydrolyzing) [Mariprofundaceae bacterium]